MVRRLSNALFALTALRYAEAATKGTIVNERGVNANEVTANVDGLLPNCNFTGEVIISHPMSMNEEDKFFSTGQLQMKAIEMMVDYVNIERCGISLPSGAHSIKLRTYGDDSDKTKITAIANFTKDDTDFFVGPYSSGLTGNLASVVQENDNVLIAGEYLAYRIFEYFLI